MTFKRYDAGEVHRTKHGAGDCQVRALSVARGIRYKDAWDLLYQIQGELRACAFPLLQALDNADPRFGPLDPLTFPALRHRPRMSVRRFVELYPRGRFILRCAHHVLAVKEGVYYDIEDCGQSCVYRAWGVTLDSSRKQSIPGVSQDQSEAEHSDHSKT